MRKMVIAAVVACVVAGAAFADWGLWDATRSYVGFNTGSAVDLVLWNAGTGSFDGHNFGTVSTFTWSYFDVKTWKNGGSDVTGCSYFYSIYSGTRPTDISFTEAAGGHLENIDTDGNQKWGDSSVGINLLTGLTPGQAYTLEIYGRVAGSAEHSDGVYDNNNNSPDNYTASFTTAIPEPATMALLGLGLSGVLALRRRK